MEYDLKKKQKSFGKDEINIQKLCIPKVEIDLRDAFLCDRLVRSDKKYIYRKGEKR